MERGVSGRNLSPAMMGGGGHQTPKKCRVDLLVSLDTLWSGFLPLGPVR